MSRFKGKKAREIAMESIRSIKPRLQTEEEKGWTGEYIDQGKLDIAHYRQRWYADVPGSRAPDHVLIGGIQAMENRGYDVTEAEKLIDPTEEAFANEDHVTFLKNYARIFNLLSVAPKNEKSDYWKYTYYDSFDQYLEKVDFPEKEELTIDKAEFLEKMHAAWSAQIAGGGLGTMIEGYTADNLEETFGNITDYLRQPSTHNDDILFELSLIDAVVDKGRNVTAEDIGLEWVGNIIYQWSAEEVAFENLRRGIFPPESAKLNNPWNEWIGAQMRGAVCGLICPQDPKEAARLAWMDGSVSHINNGIIGEVFNAILVSLAWNHSDVREILEKTIALIPDDSEYYSVVKFAHEECKKTDDWKKAWKICEEKYAHYNWIHAYPNAAAEIVALYFGREDFDSCMNIIAMCGQDVDCNAGMIATVYGILHGFAGIDERWTAPFNDQFESLHRNYMDTTIKAIAEETVKAYEKYYNK